MDFQVTHGKITKLIAELRSWDAEVSTFERPTMNMLSERFELPLDVIKAIAEAEGVDVRWIDPSASTLDLDPKEIGNALELPEPNPEFEDEDTGNWRRQPTGEWERVPLSGDPDDD